MLPQHYRTAFSAQTGTCLKCIDDVTVTKTITTRANQKPWMTAEVRGLLKTRDEAFRSGDKAALKTARANLSCGIKNAKRSYAQKINNHFTDSRDTRSLWQAIQTITDYKPPPQACDDDPSLPDTLNHFYSQFEMQNDTPAQKLPTPPNDQALCLSPADVRKTLSRINPERLRVLTTYLAVYWKTVLHSWRMS